MAAANIGGGVKAGIDENSDIDALNMGAAATAAWRRRKRQT